ncbi:hypothetical protein BsWGS_17753 [Bradybaena similaris]
MSKAKKNITLMSRYHLVSTVCGSAWTNIVKCVAQHGQTSSCVWLSMDKHHHVCGSAWTNIVMCVAQHGQTSSCVWLSMDKHRHVCGSAWTNIVMCVAQHGQTSSCTHVFMFSILSFNLTTELFKLLLTIQGLRTDVAELVVFVNLCELLWIFFTMQKCCMYLVHVLRFLICKCRSVACILCLF